MIARLTHLRVQLCFWIAFVCAAQLALSSPIQATPDSMYYFDIARSIAAGNGISSEIYQIDSRSVPDYLSYWPPLYPASLALPLMLGLDFPGAALVVNALSLALLGVSVGLLCLRLGGLRAACAGLALWMLCIPFHSLSFYALSETLFCALAMLALYLLAGATGARSFVAVGALAGLATLTRAIGIVLLVPGLAAALWQAWRERERRAARLAMMVAALVGGFLAVVSVFWLNNLALGGGIFGLAQPSPGRPLRTVLSNTGRTLLTDLWPLTLFAAGVIGIAQAVHRTPAPPGPVGGMGDEARILMILTLYTAGYLGFLVISSIMVRFNVVHSRLTLAVYPATIVLLAYLVARLTAGRSDALFWLVSVGVWLVVGALTLRYSPRSQEALAAREAVFEASEFRNLAAWVQANTGGRDLLIGEGTMWDVRVMTQRPVLVSGYPGMKPLDAPQVCNFLSRFRDRFGDVYYVLISRVNKPAAELGRAFAAQNTALEFKTQITAPDGGRQDVFQVKYTSGVSCQP